jgi:dCMP deaminase
MSTANQHYVRPGWDEYFMEIMEAVSKRATCDRGRSGCVVVRDNHILTTGYVGAPPGLPHCDDVGHQMKSVIHEDGHQTQHCVRTAHAEQNAIVQAARIGVPLLGATLYCRMTPCANCARSIIGAGIRRVCCEKRYHAAAESEAMFAAVGIELEYTTEETQAYARQ